MRRLSVNLAVWAVVAGLAIAGCTQAAPTPAPAPPAKQAEPAKAPAAQPAAEAAKKAEYPIKGKPIIMVVAYAAGGSMDIGARILAPLMEKELGVPVQVLNKTDAPPQGGDTEVLMSNPDGHTIGYMSTASILPYIDPDRKTPYGRKDVQTVALLVVDPQTLMVKAEGPIKTVKDLVDAAKARPGQLRFGSAGALGIDHLGVLLFQKAAGVKFKAVHFTGAAPAATAMLGDNVDFLNVSLGSAASYYKSGTIRYLAAMDRTENKLFPGIPTLESQGYKLYVGTARGIVVPSRTPKETVDTLGRVVKKAVDSEEYQKKMEAAGLPQRYLDAAGYSALWDEYETMIKPLYEEGKAEMAK